MTTAVVQLDANNARALTDQIKVAVEATWELVKRAYVERAWAALGYDGWDDYCTREFGTSRLRLPREERAEVVASLRESGLSVRAIASATGINRETIRQEVAAGDKKLSPQITGTDGKAYSPTQPPRPAPVDLDIECSGCTRDFPPASITEMDYETLLCPDCLDEYDEAEQSPPTVAPQAQQASPRRQRPITEAFDSANYELRRAVERVVKLSGDDRFKKNKDQISGANLSDLIRVRDALNGVITQLEG